MKSHDQSRDGSNLIEKISYLPKVNLSLVIHYLTYLIFLIKLLNQPFESTNKIKLLIELAVLLACSILLPQTIVRI